LNDIILTQIFAFVTVLTSDDSNSGGRLSADMYKL
jgi:hypothetical protein